MSKTTDSPFLEIVKKYLGERLFTFITIMIFGFIVAIMYPKFLVTPEVLASTRQELTDERKSEDSRIERRLDMGFCSFTVQNVDLETSLLTKEQNEILDIIDSGKAKQHHYVRLKEIANRLIIITKIKLDNEDLMQKYANK